jgi:hypothetical protein
MKFEKLNLFLFSALRIYLYLGIWILVIGVLLVSAEPDELVPQKTIIALSVHPLGHLQTLRRRKNSVPAALESICKGLIH